MFIVIMFFFSLPIFSPKKEHKQRPASQLRLEEILPNCCKFLPAPSSLSWLKGEFIMHLFKVGTRTLNNTI